MKVKTYRINFVKEIRENESFDIYNRIDNSCVKQYGINGSELKYEAEIVFF